VNCLYSVLFGFAGNRREGRLARLLIVGSCAQDGDIAVLRELRDVFRPELACRSKPIVDRLDIHFSSFPKEIEGPHR
jgi:hypothetical protein